MGRRYWGVKTKATAWCTWVRLDLRYYLGVFGNCCILGGLERKCDLGFTEEHNGAVGFVWNSEI